MICNGGSLAYKLCVRIFDPIHIANHVKTHVDRVQVLDNKPNSILIKANTKNMTNTLI